MFELKKEFRFEAAHTLNRNIETESSRRIHGHSYRAEVTIFGEIDPVSGMVIDFGLFHEALMGVTNSLDHRFLDEVEGLGPPTLENLSVFIWQSLAGKCPGLKQITVYRDSAAESCTYRGGISQTKDMLG